ncbi:MAG: toprim domain-containing protein [Betaproteobacteria bacterium]|nr:toprim domain-containing protein [Betaproteobacteria bacterium]
MTGRFIEFARLQGVAINPAKLVADGRIHRADVGESASGKGDASYLLRENGSGWVINFKGTGKPVYYRPEHARDATPEELAKIEAARQAWRAEQAARQHNAIAESVALWNRARDGNEFPYLKDPDIPAFGLRQAGGRLCVPLMTVGLDGDAAWVGMQRIDWGEPGHSTAKRFVPGTPTKGAFSVIPITGSDEEAPLRAFDAAKTAKQVAMCEGIGTALAIHRATGLPVVAAMSAQNLPDVARILRSHLQGDVVIYADNDGEKASYKGQRYAAEAAGILGERTRIALPVKATGDTPSGYDARDQLRDVGSHEVAKTIADATHADGLRVRVGNSEKLLGLRRGIDAASVKRQARNFAEARNAADEFKGKKLVNQDTGLVAMVSRNSLDKMLSRSAVNKSTSPADHCMAVANLDHLFERGVREGVYQDRDKDPEIKSIQRFYAPMRTGIDVVKIKLTVKEWAQGETPNTIYSVESASVERLVRNVPETGVEWANDAESSARAPHTSRMESIDQWVQGVKDFFKNSPEEKHPARIRVNAAINSDGLNPTSTPHAGRVSILLQQALSVALDLHQDEIQQHTVIIGPIGNGMSLATSLEPSNEPLLWRDGPVASPEQSPAIFDPDPGMVERNLHQPATPRKTTSYQEQAMNDKTLDNDTQRKEATKADNDLTKSTAATPVAGEFDALNQAAAEVESQPVEGQSAAQERNERSDGQARAETPEERLLREYATLAGPVRSQRAKAQDDLAAKQREQREVLFDSLDQLRADKMGEYSGMAEEHRRSLIAIDVAKAVEAMQKRQMSERKTLQSELPDVPSYQNFLEDRARTDPVAARMLEAERSRAQIPDAIKGKRVAPVEPAVLEGLTHELEDGAAGKAIHYSRDGERVMSDRGERVDLYKMDDREIEAALRLAEQKYDMDKGLVLTGSREFQQRAAEVAGRMGLKIQNEDLHGAWEHGRLTALHSEEADPTSARGPTAPLGGIAKAPAPGLPPAQRDRGAARNPAVDPELLAAESILSHLPAPGWDALVAAGKGQPLTSEQRALLDDPARPVLVDEQARLTELGQQAYDRLKSRSDEERELLQQQLRTRNIDEELEKRERQKGLEQQTTERQQEVAIARGATEAQPRAEDRQVDHADPQQEVEERQIEATEPALPSRNRPRSRGVGQGM